MLARLVGQAVPPAGGLFFAQDDDGVDSRGAAGWGPAGDQRDEGEQRGDGAEGERIGRGDAVKKIFHGAGREPRG